MSYEYSGYLSTLITAPDTEAVRRVPSVVFSHEDLGQWSLTDDPAEKEWQQVPVHCHRGADAVRLEGRFEDVRRIDSLGAEDPSFWVALSSRNWRGGGFPVDVTAYPIAEITYRCATQNARPAWVWAYPGGEHFDGLRATREWRTVARLVPHFGFPKSVSSLTIRLFSGTRTTESVEVREVRFRAMTEQEAAACRANEERIEALRDVPRYPVLDEFMPFGTYVAGGTAKRMARIMEVSLRDYWRLAMEDMVRHYHNSITVEEIEAFTPDEWRELLAMAQSFHIKVHAQLSWPLDEFDARAGELFDTWVRPYLDCEALFAWSIRGEPPEHTFGAYMRARRIFEETDPRRPLAVTMRNADALPLFAPFLPAAAVSHFKSHNAWDVAPLLSTHHPLAGGQHFWFVAPAFTYATDTPEWYTCPELRLMLNLALACGARGWFAHTYHNIPVWVDGSFQRSLTGPFLTFSDLWAELGLRVERLNALAPLFLETRPAEEGNIRFRLDTDGTPRHNRPRGMPAVEHRVLAADDFCLYYVYNNDIQDVAPANLTFHGSDSLEVHDVTDYVRNRHWAPTERRRHVEMFPGQGRAVLVAPREVCERLRVRIAERIIEDDSRQIAVDLGLARRYDLATGPVQQLMEQVGSGQPWEDIAKTLRARNLLVDLVYAASNIVEPRSKLIEVSAAICGCDGALCRLLGRGRLAQAQQLGLKVLGVARELTHLRLELREGKGARMRDYCNDLSRRTLAILGEIRAVQ